MRRLALIPLLAAAIASVAPTPPAHAAAQPEVTIENVRVGFGEGLAGNRYKMGTWTPVWVDLKAGPSAFEGVIELVAPDDGGTPTTIRRAVTVRANEMATVTLYTRPGSMAGDMGMRAISLADRRTKATWNGGSIEMLGPEVALVLTAGQPLGVSDLKDLSKYAGNAAGLSPRLLVSALRPRDGWPNRWYGLDGADAVVIDTNDASTMTRLREAESLFEWVRQGGHLVVAVGQNWQAVKDSPLAALLPGVPAGRIELTDPGLIDQFAASGNKPLLPPGSQAKVQVTKFEDWESRGGIPLASSSASPLVLRGPYGFGRVTMVGLDVDVKPFASWDEKKLFWDKMLDLRGRASEAISAQPGNAFYRAGSNDLSASLHDSLERFPGVKLVPFGWVAFFVFVYILLIGPGDYLFLRKVVKRMEMTWITFPLIVIVVSGLAYAAAYYFKGTELRINKVDALDVDQVTGRVRGTTWVTLFSPQNQDYDVGVAPLPPGDEPPAEAVVSAKASPPGANVETLVSWFGAPENPYSGGGGMSLAGGGYDYAPMSEPEEVKGVRVPIWSTKSFTGRWSGATDAPILESDLTPDGPDRLRGTVTNVSRRPMKGAALFFGRFVYVLPDLAPGATVTLGEAQALAGYMDGVSKDVANRGVTYYGARPGAVSDDASAEASRPDLLRAILFHSGLGSKGAAMSSHALGSLDLTAQLELRRPMLVAEVAGPAARLRLDGNTAKPKMSQTTLLRVILALKPEAGAPAARP